MTEKNEVMVAENEAVYVESLNADNIGDYVGELSEDEKREIIGLIKSAKQACQQSESDFAKISASDIEDLSDSEKFELLQKELEATNKMDIDGNQYTKVAVRVNLFRKYFGFDYSILTDRLSSGDTEAVFKTTIRKLSNDKVVATGHSRKANYQDGNIPGFEFAETASIGRALSAFGIIGGEFASLEEVGVQSREVASRASINVIIELAKEAGEDIESISAGLRHKSLANIMKEEALNLITRLNLVIAAKKAEKDKGEKKPEAKGRGKKVEKASSTKPNAKGSDDEEVITLL